MQWRITIDVQGGGRQRGLEGGYGGPSTKARSTAASKTSLSPTTRTSRTSPTTWTSTSSPMSRSSPATPVPKTSTSSGRNQRSDPSPSPHETSQEASSSGAQRMPELPTAAQNESTARPTQQSRASSRSSLGTTSMGQGAGCPHDLPKVATSTSSSIARGAAARGAAARGAAVTSATSSTVRGFEQAPTVVDTVETHLERLPGTFEVCYAPSRGYAYHRLTCSNVKGSAKRLIRRSLQHAVDRGLVAGRCCFGSGVRIV